ncbi:MAG: hypothetical protein P8Y29_10850 [Gemmatimonadota bacterium]|jgi:hypothetical protein
MTERRESPRSESPGPPTAGKTKGPRFESAPPINAPSEFGICTANPDGEEHRFIDRGKRFGTLRWRCSFCNRSIQELRDGASIERL